MLSLSRTFTGGFKSFRFWGRPEFRCLSSIGDKTPLPGPPSAPRNPMTEISLTKPISGFENVRKISSEPELQPSPDVTRVTTLSNGLRVATEPGFGRFCTVGVIADSGSRYEVAYPSGISHFLEKLAFNSTEKFTNRDDIMNRLEQYGGIFDCQSTRDTFLYAASVENHGLETAVEILGDVILRPKVSEEEVEFARMAVQYDIQDLDIKPDQEPLLQEAIHAAAFSNNTLGLPKICPEANLNSINRQILVNYLSQYHVPNRMVLAAVGVDHDRLVKIVEKYFVEEKPSFGSASQSNKKTDSSLAQYTGGLVTIKKDLSNASLGPTPMPDLVYASIGLESVSHQHPDFITFCVLNMLMGGGGSFSAGGPGKGMYTRLYTQVLNRYHWMYSATAYNHAYNDAGIFCINASGPPGYLPELLRIISTELTKLTHDVTSEQFERAKTQLTSMLLMNLEARPVIFEDVARQVLAQGERKRPEHFMEEISKIQIGDIKQIVDKMLSTRPSVAVIGNLEKLPEFKDIELGLLDAHKASKSKFNFLK